MQWRTHLAAGAAAAGIICHALKPNALTGCVIIAGCAVGSLLPDIDCTNSKLSASTMTTECISILTEETLGHRGAVHTPFAMMLLTVLTMLAGIKYHAEPAKLIASVFFGVSLVIGFGTHLLLDALTPMGIMPFYPVRRDRISIPSRFSTHVGEYRLFAILFLLDVVLYFIIPR